ncbi:MAG: JAB domain-containing protein [Solirubrobacterales bacterium]
MGRPALHRLPCAERPRERLWRLGPGALSDRELIALLLGSGVSGRSVLELAEELLADVGGVHGLARARVEELAVAAGVGIARAASLASAMELGRRAALRPADGDLRVAGTRELGRIAVAELSELKHERLIAIVLGPGNRLRRIVRVAEGWSDRSPVPVREILGAVLRNDGVAFGLAHNHPSGDSGPSLADLRATGEVERAANAAGLRLLDHLVVANGSWSRVRRGPG